SPSHGPLDRTTRLLAALPSDERQLLPDSPLGLRSPYALPFCAADVVAARRVRQMVAAFPIRLRRFVATFGAWFGCLRAPGRLYRFESKEHQCAPGTLSP